MSKKWIIPTAIAFFLTLYCVILITAYLFGLDQEITFVEFLGLLLIPVAVGVTAICKLIQIIRRNN